MNYTIWYSVFLLQQKQLQPTYQPQKPSAEQHNFFVTIINQGGHFKMSAFVNQFMEAGT
jgi:hypothetical protein